MKMKWACLLINTDAMSLVNDPPSANLIPILTCDVWEHAYYLDYANLRPNYVDTFLDKLVNWDFVAETLDRAMESGRTWSS